jgi:hypothetical protein
MTDYALAFYLVNEQSSHDYEPLWTESTRRSPLCVPKTSSVLIA